MKNAMQLKAIAKNIAKEKGVSAQSILQEYTLERLLYRISKSRFRNALILKGGFLIASLVGVNSRSTMDMDLTVNRYPVSEQSMEEMFREICNMACEDDFQYEFCYVEPIRDEDEYEGYRIHLKAKFQTLVIDLKLDVTTGDEITPSEIQYDYPMMLEEGVIPVFAYNLETILAEKMETVISRSVLNTRPRDFYDIYILYQLHGANIQIDVLKNALKNTCMKRASYENIKEHAIVLQNIRQSDTMQNYYRSYQEQFGYAKEISFDSILDLLEKLFSKLL